MVLGLLIGGLLGYILTKLSYRATVATYDRSKYDSYINSMYYQYYFDDILTDELLIISYNLNREEPRLFSKYYAKT